MRAKPNLDFLRSCAILLVVFDHLRFAEHIGRAELVNPRWFGLMGVYWFFVHTCVVLMWSLERKPHILDFYIRRAFRIYPLSIVSVLVAASFRDPLMSAAHNAFHDAPLVPVLSNIFLVQNMLGRSVEVNVVLWSLPIEVDMYLVLPVLFFFVRENFRLWPLLVLWGAAVSLARPQAPLVGNVFFTCIPCFLPGVMAYVLFRQKRPVLPAWTFPVFLVGLGAAFVSVSRVVAAWPMCLALGLCLPLFRQISCKPLVRISHEIAKYSYGMYLGHWFMIVVGVWVFRAYPLSVQIGVVLVGTAVIAFLGYHLIEKPMINLGARLAAEAERRFEMRELEDAA